jgi:adenylosuccinate lyase
MENTDCISPLDGRYHRATRSLSSYFSEKALIKYRIRVEAEYLLALSELGLARFKRVSAKEKDFLRKLWLITDAGARRVKLIETSGVKNIPATKHDVKAVEYFIKEKLRAAGMTGVLEWTHFALTSEDTNSVAYGLLLRDALSEIVIPEISELCRKLDRLAKKHAADPLLARTHGQPAVGTTFGKEFRVFQARLRRQLAQLKKTVVLVKFNGAVGNFNAHLAALPSVKWRDFSEKFAERFNSGQSVKIAANPVTTQIEPHDNQAEIFDNMRRINAILTDFCQDLWRYIGAGLIIQKTSAGEIGSSTMPQKINPIDFENAEGNLGLASALFTYFSAKLPISRLQRDLSDSTVQRNIGCAFAYGSVAYASILRGLAKIEIDKRRALRELRLCPETIAEAIQTVLRREGVSAPYEKVKALTRGKKPSQLELEEFIKGLKIKEPVKRKLLQLRSENYLGLAREIARG